ncbi:MAG: histidine phosphatase family protein [Acidobacteria bacterium]|nr:histidine phosphatase family protein [Acidobacteriota bacterium]
MRRHIRLRLGAWRLTAAILVVSSVSSLPAQAAQVIVVVRHAERETGQGDDSLSAAGRERAERLVFVLSDVNVTHVLTSDRKRTIETAAPLTEKRGLTSTAIPMPEASPGGIDPTEQQIAATLDAINRLPETARVLVVGHSNTVPILLKALGVTESVTIRDDEFDNLFVVAPRAGGTTSLTRLRY